MCFGAFQCVSVCVSVCQYVYISVSVSGCVNVYLFVILSIFQVVSECQYVSMYPKRPILHQKLGKSKKRLFKGRKRGQIDFFLFFDPPPPNVPVLSPKKFSYFEKIPNKLKMGGPFYVKNWRKKSKNVFLKPERVVKTIFSMSYKEAPIGPLTSEAVSLGQRPKAFRRS